MLQRTVPGTAFPTLLSAFGGEESPDFVPNRRILLKNHSPCDGHHSAITATRHKVMLARSTNPRTDHPQTA
jgi:hypothetical protein